jgi:polyhydroxyalkanoate synthesis regulator phasin
VTKRNYLMLELIRTTLLAGLGAGVITKEKADEAVGELVQQGKLRAEEAEQVVGKLLASGSQQWEDVQAGLSGVFRDALNAADVARAKEVKGFAQRLEKAEQRIAMLEDAIEQIRSAGQS